MKDIYYLKFKCNKCKRVFLIPVDEYNPRTRYLVCPQCSNKDISTAGSFDNLKECMKGGDIDVTKLHR